MKTRTIVCLVLIGAFVAGVMAFILDYCNVFTLVGLNPNRINQAFIDVFVTSLTVVVLYLISYFVIDRRQSRKDDNAKNISCQLIVDTYTDCLKQLQILEDKGLIQNYINPKLRGDVAFQQNTIILNIQNAPFSSFDALMTFATEGHLSENLMKPYLEIRNRYKRLVNMKIIFFDVWRDGDPQHEEFVDWLEEETDSVFDLIRGTIDQIKGEGK